MTTKSTTFFSFMICLLLAACSTVENHESAKYEEEGLDTIYKNAKSELYIRPDITLPLYQKLYIQPVTVEYSKQKHNDPGFSESDFQFDDKELAYFQQQFYKAMSESWTRVEGRSVIDSLDEVKKTDQEGMQAAHNTLIIKVSITDLYLYASIKNNKAGRNTTLVNESSKMVINMELLNADTGEILIRSMDKVTTGNPSEPKRQMTGVSYFNDVYLTFRSWINQLSSRLD